MATVDSIERSLQAAPVATARKGGAGDAEAARRGAVLRLALGPQRRAAEPDPRRERELVRAAQGGSEEALEALFRRHWPAAHRAAFLVVHDAQAAEDIAQEAFIAAIRALDRFDRRRPFRPWLHRIVVNRAIDHARIRTLRAEVGGEAAEAVAPEPRDGLGGELLAALAELGAEQRAAIVLRFLLDYTPGEIARLLGVPRGTVNSRLRRGLDRLAGVLEEEPR